MVAAIEGAARPIPLNEADERYAKATNHGPKSVRLGLHPGILVIGTVMEDWYLCIAPDAASTTKPMPPPSMTLPSVIPATLEGMIPVASL